MTRPAPWGGLSKSNLKKFEGWLVERGAELLKPTNRYELLRFIAKGETCVFYANAQGRITGVPPEPCREAYDAFRTGASWSGNSGVTPKRKAMGKHVSTLLERDGQLCFLCGEPLGDSTTVDHLVRRGSGGPNHIHNFVLMHRLCNQRADAMSAMEKIAEHVGWRIRKFKEWLKHGTESTGPVRLGVSGAVPLAPAGGDHQGDAVERLSGGVPGVGDDGAGVVQGAEQRPAEEAGPHRPDDGQGEGRQGEGAQRQA